MNIETTAVLAAIWSFVKGLLPGAFGAAVAVSMDKSADFLTKTVQFFAGIVVSYYAGAAIQEATSFGPMVQQSISFTLGMIAYKSAKSFIKGAEETAGSIPRDLWDGLKKRLGLGK